MSAERWVIHDKEREKAVIHYKKDWIIMDGSELPPIKYSKNEICYQSLWKKFFDNIAVKKSA